MNSLSYFGSVRHSVAPYGTSTSSPPATQTISSMSPSYPPNAQGINREGIIVPFTLPPSDMTSLPGSSTNLSSDRKRPDGAIIPVYDPPNALPYNAAPAFSETSTTRPRINPPAYSDVDRVSVVPTPTHQKKDSGDTQFSADSKTGSVVQKQHGGAGGGSISTIEEVIGQMGLEGQESVSAGGTLSTGQSGQFPSARPFRPVLGNPDQ
ncbi:hypothetical protein C0992_010636 [Termitomyces sp. T32_za158]|nr:hypothetical protein C0992_010636 [Termitomyces sp. T32_za158]